MKTQDTECCVEQKGLEFVDATGLCGLHIVESVMCNQQRHLCATVTKLNQTVAWNLSMHPMVAPVCNQRKLI